MKNCLKVVIIGSGLASISAAKVAISKGYKPLIIDPNNKAPNKSKVVIIFLLKTKIFSNKI